MRRWVVIGLLCLIGAGQARASAPVPAEVLAETRLGPAAGNATHPFATALDTRRNQLWVLNRVPQSLAIVDLATRRMIVAIPLSAPTVPEFDGWFNSSPYIWMGYDPGSDRVLVGSGNSSAPSVLVSVDAGTRKIAATRTLADRLTYRWAVNTKRGELVVAGMGRVYPGGFGLLIVDAKTLQTHADFATNRQTEAIAVSERTGRVFTVEPSAPHPSRVGMDGPYSATRIFIRNPISGAIVARSTGEYSYPRALLIDDASGRLYLVHRKNPAGVNLISNDSNAIVPMAQSTLKADRRIQFADPDPNRSDNFLTWDHSWLDAPRHRLIVDFYSGTLGVLPLTGPAKAARVPVEGSLYSDYRLAGVLQRSGQAILLIDNAVRLLNSRSLQAGASITMGATTLDLFLDAKQHRLLAHVDRDIHEFLMLENGVPRRLFKSYVLPRTHLLAVDFDRETIYHVYNDGWGNSAALKTMNFKGQPVAGGYVAQGEFAGLILTDTPGRSFRLLYPANLESVNSIKRYSLDLLEQGREIKSVALPHSLTVLSAPQVLYAARTDRVYIVLGQSMMIYAGSDLAHLGTVSLDALPKDRFIGGLAGSMTIDAEGQFGYFADPAQRQIIKFSLADGGIVDRRELTFAPTLPLVDSASGRLYVANETGGRVVALRLF